MIPFVVKWDFVGPDAARVALLLHGYGISTNVPISLVRDPRDHSISLIHATEGQSSDEVLQQLHDSLCEYAIRVSNQVGWKCRIHIWAVTHEEYMRRLIDLLQDDGARDALEAVYATVAVVPMDPSPAPST